MNESPIGRIVISKAGRDRGRAFVIVGIADEDHVLLSDGVLRSVMRPKKKKLRHLRVTDVSAEAIREQSERGLRPTDAELRSALRALGMSGQEPEQEG